MLQIQILNFSDHGKRLFISAISGEKFDKYYILYFFLFYKWYLFKINKIPLSFPNRAIQPGTLILDSSTIDPSVSKEMAALASKKGAVFMDSPVSGGLWNHEFCTVL